MTRPEKVWAHCGEIMRPVGKQGGFDIIECGECNTQYATHCDKLVKTPSPLTFICANDDCGFYRDWD